MNRLPLGASALAGTTFPIDRESVAAELGFDGVAENSLDAVSDRDFAKANKLAAELARAYPAVRLRVPLVETPPELRPGTPQTLSAVLPQGVKHGAVVLWCAIDTNGKVTDARIEQSLSPEADAKALEAVKAWKFQPAKKNGNPVAVDVRITLVVENNGR